MNSTPPLPGHPIRGRYQGTRSAAARSCRRCQTAEWRCWRRRACTDSYWLYHHLNIDVARLGPLPNVIDRIADDELDIGLERVAVDWHLHLPTLLTQTRETKDWDPAWGQVVLDGAAEGLIVAGPFAGRLVASELTWERDRERWAGDPGQRHVYEEQVLLHEATTGWPRVVVLDTLRQNAPQPSPDWADKTGYPNSSIPPCRDESFYRDGSTMWPVFTLG